ncbi:D-alanyl-D-alanine carboxypeptidase family protein [Anaerocolumna xylanovorans]|uniref:D-alanyl-D-alanine carboxypeptidase n=1 Tax=Anaerocolumna xylanovorans DSM 12503 TaxID=1121345 RepID=A0A1M7YNM2_9FIRM|nr:D-alanyl-D-alanine carboxypeptidase family protein [Anaerocolumna xylanovorans]SHO54254.1 D-alanyl-D-alanine carboxypeptidase [Anaerocolumna xylanovorans DSM 12503]
MKKLRVLISISALCLLILNTSLTSVQAQSNSADSTAATQKSSGQEALNIGDKPSIASKAAIVMEASTGTILYAKNIHDKHYPASITKILTALVALENSSPGEVLTFSKNAIYDVDLDSSRIGIDVGEKLTMEQSLYAVMLESANEVAYGVAEHVAGSVPAFTDLMNKKAASLGCVDSHFVNPHGLPDDNHYTSAYDMALISRAAINNETFQKITGTKTYAIPPTNLQSETRYLANHHKMVKGSIPYEGVIGGKTGYTLKSKYTLVTFAKRNGMTLISVIMCCDSIPNEYADTKALLNYGFENYSIYNISQELDPDKEESDSLFTKYAPLFSRKTSSLKLSTKGSVVLPKGISFKKAEKAISYVPVEEIKNGDNVIGSMRFTYKNTYIGSADILYTKNTSSYMLNNNFIPETPKTIVTKGVQMPVDTNADKHRLQIVIISIIVIVILISTTLYLIFIELPYRKRRNAYTAKKKKSKKHYSKNDFLDL